MKIEFNRTFPEAGIFLKQFGFTRANNDDIFEDLLQRGGYYAKCLVNDFIQLVEHKVVTEMFLAFFYFILKFNFTQQLLVLCRLNMNAI